LGVHLHQALAFVVGYDGLVLGHIFLREVLLEPFEGLAVNIARWQQWLLVLVSILTNDRLEHSRNL